MFCDVNVSNGHDKPPRSLGCGQALDGREAECVPRRGLDAAAHLSHGGFEQLVVIRRFKSGLEICPRFERDDHRIGADGELESLTSASTRPVAQIVTHAGICGVDRFAFSMPSIIPFVYLPLRDLAMYHPA